MWRMPHRYLWHKRATVAQGRFDGVWSISYADLMTLLLCFFVVILAVSPPPVVRGEKATSVMASLRSAFGTAGGASATPAKPTSLLEQLVAVTETHGSGRTGSVQRPAVNLTHERDGLHIVLHGEAAFVALAPSGAKLATDAEGKLRQMAAALRQLSPRIEVRAYRERGDASGNTGTGGTAAQATGGFDDGFAHARAVADVLAQCGLTVDRLQLMAARDAVSIRPDQDALSGGSRRVEVIVQAQGGEGRTLTPAAGLPAAAG